MILYTGKAVSCVLWKQLFSHCPSVVAQSKASVACQRGLSVSIEISKSLCKSEKLVSR